MASLLRDTQFGHFLRFISGNKLLRYPEEIDSSLWKKPIQKDTNPSIPREHNSLEKTESKNSAIATATATDTDTDTPTPNHDLQDLRDNHIAEQGEDGFLVDWYGPNDPEVSIYPHRFYVANPSNTPLRIHRIGPASRSFWWLLKCAFLPFLCI
jgi:DHA1 family multidrug resistance protein-like MFS transporter